MSASSQRDAPRTGTTGPRPVEPNGVYVTQWNMGRNKLYHYGIFVATSTDRGVSFHCTNNLETNGKWTFRARRNYSYDKSVTFICALKVSEVDGANQAMLDHIEERFSEIEFISKSGSCRTWAMSALFLLAEEGFIGLPADRLVIDAIEMEANAIASDCMDSQVTQVVTSEHYCA